MSARVFSDNRVRVRASGSLRGRTRRRWRPLLTAAALLGSIAVPAAETFTILPAPAQDPQVTWHKGAYYYCESSPTGISLRVAPDFLRLGSATPQRVWSPPRSGPASRNLWAPELHVLDGRCYIYFAADDGENAHHRMWVLVSADANPLGPYTLAGQLETQGWAIDGTVLTSSEGARYFIWSGWPGARNGQQNLYLAAMKSPTALTGPRVLIARPDQPWERHGMPICEGPQILQRDGRTFLVYSASGSWTEDYCLGLLELTGSNPLRPSAWRKRGVVFQKNEYAWGVGHCGFVQTPDGREDWLFYHAKTAHRDGWDDREVRAQHFTWTPDGRPAFAAPFAVVEPASQPLRSLILAVTH